MAAQLLRLGRRLRIALWILFVVSAVATVHLGWHYVIDDIAGVGVGLMALVLARILTGYAPRAIRRCPGARGRQQKPVASMAPPRIDDEKRSS